MKEKEGFVDVGLITCIHKFLFYHRPLNGVRGQKGK